MGKKFFYQLKVKKESTSYSDEWQVIWFDIVEAESKADVKKSISEEHQAVIAEKATKKNSDKIDYRVFITELSEDWEKHWLTVRTCKVCGLKYDLLNAKRNGEDANHDICSTSCRRAFRKENDFGDYVQGYLNHRPCIYRITNKDTGKVYIGQTTQCFTLRWYQHFFQVTDTKFHKAVKESRPSDWTFEVLEVIYEPDYKSLLNEREQYWIEKHNSIEDGYNSVRVAKTDANDDQ